MIRSLFLILAALTLSAQSGLGASSASAPASAFRTLARIDTFAFGGIGVAGTISPGEIAFREILAGPHAVGDFQSLLKKGGPPAQCYALVALHVLEPDAFKDAAAPFKTAAAPVKTIAGCSISTLPMRSIVANISKGNYDIYLTSPHP